MMTRKQQGFTLIELISVMVLVSIIVAISSQMLAQGFNAYLTSEDIIDANWQGQMAIERMVRDIRTVRSANDISVKTSSAFTFVNLAGNTMAYSLSGSNLMLNGNILANGVNSLTFTYYDKNGTPGASTANLNYVNIALNITQNNANFSVNTTAFLRDLSS
jgi:prepilin-type N-terminal cleavage/methylation domain-containing protein